MRVPGELVGDLCGCEGTPCFACAEGFFGPTCKPCPGGGGILECSKHGRCDDGLHGSGECVCDRDDRAGGLGMFTGAQCDACQGEFFGHGCAPCPDLAITADAAVCAKGSFVDLVAQTPCYMSCLGGTCNDGIQGDGTCQ